ncbi:hypothetical protein KIW84_043663 [Lathyrus oleraceus]|uniref:Uncharacterized protein n=1 Tax=Pisum sativum TaxID=3888 RepID=A0A9D4XEJ0_PEA|nr:hypothetical protein KIW84_043663 [Pisum sativum]
MNCKEDALSNVLVDTCSSLNVLPKYTLVRLSYQGTPMRKLKFVKNGMLVILGGEKAMFVTHMSSFTYVEAEEEFGTPFQALSVSDEVQKTGAYMSSLKDAREVVQVGGTDK